MKIDRESVDTYLKKGKRIVVKYKCRDNKNCELVYQFQSKTMENTDEVTCVSFSSYGDDDLLLFFGESFQGYLFRFECIDLRNNRDFCVCSIEVKDRMGFDSKNTYIKPSPKKSYSPKPKDYSHKDYSPRGSPKGSAFKYKKFG